MGLDSGESSRQGEKGDSERPLKKAKYVWQVKGKYHLKNQEKPDHKPDNMRRCDCTEQNTREERKCIDNFIAKTESILDSDDEEISKNIDKAISSDIPITLVSPNPKHQDYYLRKWQAKQIARAYIDNTINRVFETWVSVPFEAEDLVENCDNGGRVEDQGILMAIEAHGLQSQKKETLPFLRPEELADKTLEKIDTARSQLIKESFGNSDELEAGLGVEYPVSVLNAAILVAIERKGLSSNK